MINSGGGGAVGTKRLNILQAVYVYLNNPGHCQGKHTVPILKYSLNSAAYIPDCKGINRTEEGGQ